VKVEGSIPLIEDHSARDVRRKEIWSELDAIPAALDRGRD